MQDMYFVYIIKCADETLYTGIATDLNRRLMEHNHLQSGAKYTRARRPVKLVYSKEYNSRKEATKEEYRIKKMTRLEKTDFVQNFSNNI